MRKIPTRAPDKKVNEVIVSESVVIENLPTNEGTATLLSPILRA